MNESINTSIPQDETQTEELSIIEKLHQLPIILIEKEAEKTFEELQAKAPGKDICFCDGYIKNIEDGYVENRQYEPVEKKWQWDGIGFKRDNVLVIDHHMALEEMRRNVSTTNFAIDYVLKYGPVDKDTVVMITHTDCDSILSSAIMRGILPPNEEFGIAAVAADHTGEPNKIGDLIQALEQDEKGQDQRDMEFSFRNLEHLLRGEELEPRAKELLEQRYKNREKVLRIIEEGMQTTESGNVFFTNLEKKIDGGLFPPIIPSAALILLYCPLYDKTTGERAPGYEAKVRLGLNVPNGTDLVEIMKNVDQIWGGRWDAGSNNRGKNIDGNLIRGTQLNIEEYAKKLDQSYQNYIKSHEK